MANIARKAAGANIDKTGRDSQLLLRQQLLRPKLLIIAATSGTNTTLIFVPPLEATA